MIELIPQDEVVSISKWIPIIKTYKYEMRPTKKQEVLSNQTLATCRHLYNDSLVKRKKGWENGGWNIQYNDQQNYLPEMRNKNDETGKYLREIYAQVLQNVIKRVDIAYQNLFRRIKNSKTDSGKKEKPGFPRFKGYGRYDSFTFPQYGNGCNIIDRKGNKDEIGNIIRLSKIGEIKFIKHREIGENGVACLIKTVTIKKEIDKWFVIFTVDTFVEIDIPTIPKYISKDRIVGIDVGLEKLATLSNGKIIEAPEYLRESEKKLAKYQRRLSRKKKYEKIVEINKKISNGIKIDKEIEKKKIKVNSKNREKQINKVRKIHRTITNQRRNFSHEVSRTLVDQFDVIAFEKLNIQNMVKNHRLAKSISDASWYQIQMFTNYKAEWAGKNVIFVDPARTSKECHVCGNIEDMKLSDRTFRCSKCGLILDRDINAAINIQNRGMKELKITPGTGGGACLSSPNRDTMIQEAPPLVPASRRA
jgi:putative transposase